MKIYVDADACPVQKEIIQVARLYDLSVVLVKSYSHFSHDDHPSFVETVYVDQGRDMADLEILKRAVKNDIVITQDYGLASLLLPKGCIVLHHKGFLFSEKNIDRLLSTRHASAKARRAGQRTKGPKPLTEEDKIKFSQLLIKMIEKHL